MNICLKVLALAALNLSVKVGASAQNLVPNPGFEDFKKLPCNLNEFFIQDLIEQWRQPIPSSSYYWSTLSSINCYLNPDRINRRPRTGQGMGGIITASVFRGSRREYKEYLEVELKKPLSVNRLYCGELFASHHDVSSAISNVLEDPMESNNIAMAFSDTLIFFPVSENSMDHLTYPALMMINETEVIPADKQWHRISGCFTADKGYKFLLVGNFNSINSTLFRRSVFQNELAYAYYFIDDITLFELPYAPPNLATDVTLCHSDDQLLLDATSDGATSYTWSDGLTGPQRIITTKRTASYEVAIHYGDFAYKHMFKVHYVPPIDLGRDTLLCDGERLVLKARHPQGQYVWSDGSTDSVKVVSGPDSYTVTVVTDCPISDTIEVNYIDCPGFIPNVITPNKDLLNQFFRVENIENRDWSIQIFNRWGEKVYERERYTNDWDATGLSPGVYYYLLHSPSLDRKVSGWVNVLE